MDSSPPPPATAGFSGFLTSSALIDALLHASADIAALFGGDTTNSLPLLQTRNISTAVRRVKLLSSALFDDLHSSSTSSPLPPSSALCLTELLSVLRRTHSLLSSILSGSALWSLVRTDHLSNLLHQTCTRELALALDILPLSLLPLSADAREQVDLLHRQASRARPFLDPRDLRLRDDLLHLMANNHHDCSTVENLMWRVGLRSAADYETELTKLEAEACRQAGTGGVVAVSNINNLIALLTFSKSIIFRNTGPSPAPAPERLIRSTTWSSSSSTAINYNVPEEFRCPITLDLMRDPVLIASGHTYDRSSIARWINSGHHSCPKSGQKLIHMALIPNYSLKSLIDHWCNENNVPSSAGNPVAGDSTPPPTDHISATKAAAEAVRMTAEFLVGKLAMGSPDIQRQAAYELRLLAKTGMDNRRIIAEAGAIPFLVTVLSSGDPRAQENAVTALLNLSILDNNKLLIMAAGAIDAVIAVLCRGAAAEARENAAATIFSLSMVDECKVSIGARPGAITGLVALLQEGTAAGKRDAVTALFNLAVYNGNKTRVVAAGAVPVLVGLLTDDKAGVTDDALAVLALLCGYGEGMREIGRLNRSVVPVLVELMRFGTAKGKENSISLLLGLCRDGGEEMGRRLLMNPRSVPSLQSLTESGSPKARRKAEALLRLLNRCCTQSEPPPPPPPPPMV